MNKYWLMTIGKITNRHFLLQRQEKICKKKEMNKLQEQRR